MRKPIIQKIFVLPLDIPIQLAGNFGELRTNHFHAGFDIRTQQKEGLNVYAVADGYISRIKISPYGYGKAIYIDHPGGYTTVYGHLSKGSQTVQDFIVAEQYKQKSSEIDLFPKPGDLPVKKGDLIAYSGNTGGSEGPHLHFEFRDTKTEKIINPMFFGFDKIVLDNKPPVITTLIVYPISADAQVNKSIEPITLSISKMADGTYTSELVKANGTIGFGFAGYDSQDYGSGKNGIFKIVTSDNGNPSYSYTFDSFSFEDTRFVNALIDYPRFKKNGQRIQELFQYQPLDFDLVKPGDQLGQIVHRSKHKSSVQIRSV